MVKVKIVKSNNNGVSVKVDLGKNGYTFQTGMKRFIRLNKDNDAKDYPYVVSFKIFHRFLEVNDVREEEVEIDKESIDTFYGYDGYGLNDYFVNPTPSKVDSWWNYDCPTLYRYMVNKHDEVNMLGMRLMCFQHMLCESTWNAVYIGEDITKEEVDVFCREREDTTICIEMNKVIEARELKESDIEAIRKDLNEYDATIQSVIDEHREEIMRVIAPYQDGQFGFDCGWVNIFTTNKQYNEKRKLLKNTKGELRVDNMNVQLPFGCQSTTLQKMQFDVVKTIVKEKIGEELYSQTVLD